MRTNNNTQHYVCYCIWLILLQYILLLVVYPFCLYTLYVCPCYICVFVRCCWYVCVCASKGKSGIQLFKLIAHRAIVTHVYTQIHREKGASERRARRNGMTGSIWHIKCATLTLSLSHSAFGVYECVCVQVYKAPQLLFFFFPFISPSFSAKCLHQQIDGVDGTGEL